MKENAFKFIYTKFSLLLPFRIGRMSTVRQNSEINDGLVFVYIAKRLLYSGSPVRMKVVNHGFYLFRQIL